MGLILYCVGTPAPLGSEVADSELTTGIDVDVLDLDLLLTASAIAGQGLDLGDIGAAQLGQRVGFASGSASPTAAASTNHPYAQQSLTGGMEFGVDRQVDAGTLVGALVGSSVTNLSIDALGSSVRASGVHAGLYDIASTRKFDIPEQSGSAVAAYTAGQAQVFGELAYQFLDGPSAAEAYLGLSHAHLSSTSFAETGSPLALSGRAGDGGRLWRRSDCGPKRKST